MAVRSSMTDIIQAVADLIGDPGFSLVTQQQIQDKLDEGRESVRYELLMPAPMISNDIKTNPAQMVWLEYFSQHHYWEVDEIVQDAYWVQLSPVKFEPIVGRWVFAYDMDASPGVLPPKTESPGQLPPVWVTGKVYDINKAGYKCCRLMRAALARTTYNVTLDGQTLSRQQMLANIKDVEAECARNIKPRTIPLIRSDAAITPARELLKIGGQYGTSGW